MQICLAISISFSSCQKPINKTKSIYCIDIKWYSLRNRIQPQQIYNNPKFRIGVLVTFIFLIALLNIVVRLNTGKSHVYINLKGNYQGKETLNIPFVKPASLQGTSLSEIYTIRSERLSDFSDLVSNQYQATAAVFDQLEEDTEWLKYSKLYFDGKDLVEERKEYEQSVASFQILNPLLLAKAEFWGLSIWASGGLEWNKDKVTLEYLEKNNLPLTPQPDSLIYKAGEGVAELSYNLGLFAEAVSPYLKTPIKLEQVAFSILLQNAHDFGFRYAYLDIENSESIKNSNQADKAVRIKDNFKIMRAKWDKQLVFNSESVPAKELAWIEAISIPATATIKLWLEDPIEASAAADLIFKIILN